VRVELATMTGMRSELAGTGIRMTAVMMFLVALPGYSAPDEIEKRSFDVAGQRRTYYIYSPVEHGSTAVPLLVALHGSYGKASDMAQQWMAVARAQGVIVVAPVARQPAAWHLRADGPQFIHALIDEVARQHAIDSRRLYLFGHSGGGVYALTLAMLESQYFAATAVHAAAWRTPQEFIAVPYAKRAIPVMIFIGDRDEYFTLQQVRKTHEALRTAGHPSNLSVIPGHTHNYARVAAEVNEAAWNWMQFYSSTPEPLFLEQQER
jgi:poly(3-hydroxybutyrate) depolymerase